MFRHLLPCAALLAAMYTPAAGAAATFNFQPKVSFENLSASSGVGRFLARTGRYSIMVDSRGLQFRKAGGDAAVRLRFSGANPNAEATPGPIAEGRTNYYQGNDPTKWRTGIPLFQSVSFHGIYPGINIYYHTALGSPAGEAIEYDLHIAPMADPARIRLQFDGPREIRLGAGGSLITSGGQLLQHAPVAFQVVSGQRRLIPVRLVAQGKGRFSFSVGAYDRRLPLVIDPILVYSTYFGGAGSDVGYGLDVDAQGNVYVSGYADSASPNFPVKPSSNHPHGAGDIFMAKFDPAGNLLVSTLIGGSGYEAAYSLSLDSSGNILLTGATDSSNFPTYPNGVFQTQGPPPPGNHYYYYEDAFAVKLDPNGNFIASTLLGGRTPVNSNCSLLGAGYGIASDAAGNVYVTGETCATDFPLQAPLVTTISGADECFVTALDPSLKTAIYSTYLNDSTFSYCNAIAVDTAGAAYVTGGVLDSGHATPGAAQTRFGGGVNYGDAFVAKIAPSGKSLAYYTYLGGSLDDAGNAITVDSGGNAYVTGWTQSADFPLQHPAQAVYGGGASGAELPDGYAGGDAFVAALNPAGSALTFSTYAGGPGLEASSAIALDPSGKVYIAGATTSTALPFIGSTALQPAFGGVEDAFLCSLTPDGTIFDYGTFLGGSKLDGAFRITVGRTGNIYLAGTTQSANFPSATAFQSSLKGASNAFVTVLGTPNAAAPVINAVTNGASFARAPAVSPGTLATIFGTTLVPDATYASTKMLPVILGGLSVKINGIAAPLLFVNSTQVNFQIPYEIAPGPAEAVLEQGGVASASFPFNVSATAPGIFLAGSQASAQNYPSNAANGPNAPIAAGGVVTVYLTGIGPVSSPVTTGLPTPASPLFNATSGSSATVNNVDAPILFLGLTSGFTGLAQANIKIPASLKPGSYPLIITVGGQASNGPTISVK